LLRRFAPRNDDTGPIAAMLNEWHEFYTLLGTAAAALVALLFVAVSIGTSVLTKEAHSQANTRTYMSPVVFHFANILFLSLIAMIPTLTWELFAIIIGIAAIGSAAYSIVTAMRVHHNTISDVADRLGYGAIPVLCYSAGIVTAWLAFKHNPVVPELLAVAALVLLLINIRNAWDLMISLARRVGERPPS
jgi:hypothetical protein